MSDVVHFDFKAGTRIQSEDIQTILDEARKARQLQSMTKRHLQHIRAILLPFYDKPLTLEAIEEIAGDLAPYMAETIQDETGAIFI